MKIDNPFLYWLGAFIVSAMFFYGLNHLIMVLQGLPLNLDLTPAL